MRNGSTFFRTSTLRELIDEALRPITISGSPPNGCLQAEGQLAATRSALFPQLGARANAGRDGVSSPVTSSGGGFGAAFWELDLFGKLRRATEAARADMLALEENQKAVMQVLVSDVAIGYFDLIEYDAEIQFVKTSIATREESLKLVIPGSRAASAVYGGRSGQDAGSVGAIEPGAAREGSGADGESYQLPRRTTARADRQGPGPDAAARAAGNSSRIAIYACWTAVRIFALQSRIWSPRTPALAWPRRPSFRALLSLPSAAISPLTCWASSSGAASLTRLGGACRSAHLRRRTPVGELQHRESAKPRVADRVSAVDLRRVPGSIGCAHRISEVKGIHRKSDPLAETLRHQSQIANQRYIGGVSSYLEVLDTERQRLTAEQELAQAQRDVLTNAGASVQGARRGLAVERP